MENTYFGIKDFEISADISSVKCPDGIISKDYQIVIDNGREFKKFKFNRKDCDSCKFRDQCLYKSTNGKFARKAKDIKIPSRYDAVLKDLVREKTDEFEVAYNKRYKVERRFAQW